ncbi:MAG: hypothetical protein H5U19_11345 [Rhodobacteraceae bacterium]|jgi:hypothetical protein|nr:hypothetical protein [Paracoccaceae bacterium]
MLDAMVGFLRENKVQRPSVGREWIRATGITVTVPIQNALPAAQVQP